MSEQEFNLGEVEPAKVNFIGDDNPGSEQPDDDVNPSDPATGTPDGTPDDGQQNDVASVMESEQYKNLQAAFTRASQENAELRSRIAEIEQRLAERPITHQNSFDVPPQQPAGPDELDTLAEDYTEMKPVASRVKKLEAHIRKLENELGSSRREFSNTQQQTAAELHWNKILTAHPDARTIANSADFMGWVARQPAYVQAVIDGRDPVVGSAENVIDVINQYKAATNKVDQARNLAAPRVGTAAIKTTDSNKPTFTGAQIAAMSDEEFIRREAEIQQAQMEGRVLP